MKLQLSLFACLLCAFPTAFAQTPTPGTIVAEMEALVETPAIPGYEDALAQKISAAVAKFKPRTDSLGNVIVTIGTGSPHRLLVAPMDEPGYIVTNITDQGYLRLQRLPQQGALPLFNELYSAQPVKIATSAGKWINGSVAGLSIHLQPGRQGPPNLDDIDNMYVDIGARTATEAQAGGADLLSPVVITRKLYEMGFGKWTSPAIGDRFGDLALLEFLRKMDPTLVQGTLTVAFVAQQWAGARGLERILENTHPDELIYVGRLTRAVAAPGGASSTSRFSREPGSGVLVGTETSQTDAGKLASELKSLAEKNGISFDADYSAPLLPRGYTAPPKMPARSVHLAIATGWPSTPAEFIDANDLGNLLTLLGIYLQSQPLRTQVPAAASLSEPTLPAVASTAPSPQAILQALVESYGVSDHEGRTRDTVARLLPPWAKPVTDDAGNLILHWGSAGKGSRVLVAAHMDEIGYEVHSILPNGHLELENKGGGTSAFFMGHAGLVHTSTGMRPGVIELPENWDEPNFRWPPGFRASAHFDVGARSPEQVAQLGIKVGDYVTIPKDYRPLLGSRASARAFDDRVGCAALISATWALRPQLKDRDVTFVWSTGEELGLLGASAAAKRLAAAGETPEFVFAVDTFVSSDSPLESARFADSKVGDGFVVRAVDNSNIVPRELVEKLVSLARQNHIAVQYGATGGGNDGSAFLRYGSTDVALGWPLRYSHSPAEVIDTRDLDALASIIASVARSW